MSGLFVEFRIVPNLRELSEERMVMPVAELYESEMSQGLC